MNIKIDINEEFRDVKNELLKEFKEIIRNEVSDHLSKKWIRAKELQKLTGWSSSTIQTYRSNGALTYSKVGGTVFYDIHALNNLLETNSKTNKH